VFELYLPDFQFTTLVPFRFCNKVCLLFTWNYLEYFCEKNY